MAEQTDISPSDETFDTLDELTKKFLENTCALLNSEIGKSDSTEVSVPDVTAFYVTALLKLASAALSIIPCSFKDMSLEEKKALAEVAKTIIIKGLNHPDFVEEINETIERMHELTQSSGETGNDQSPPQ